MRRLAGAGGVVVRDDDRPALLAAWKMKTEFGSPPPSSVSAIGPLIRMPDVEL